MGEDFGDALRRLIDQAAPVTEDQINAARAGTPQNGSVSRTHGRRRVLLVAASVFVMSVVAVGVVSVLLPGAGRPTDEVSSRAPVVVTALPPAGDDPLVSCDLDGGEWYRYSALSGPTGAENDADDAARTLRALLVLDEANPLAFGGPLPATGWRRLVDTGTKVLFAAGEFPNLYRVTLEFEDGGWLLRSSGSGMCRLELKAPEGQSIAYWGVDRDRPLSPDRTTLPLLIWDGRLCATAPLAEADIVGPDIVETDETVTIRVASARPMADPDEASSCSPAEYGSEPVAVEVQLKAPLGERQLFNGNRFPAEEIDLTVPEEPAPPPEVPLIALVGGTVESRIDVFVNVEGDCDRFMEGSCAVGTSQANITISSGGISASGDTNERGQARILVPGGDLEVSAVAEGLWCPTLRVGSVQSSPTIMVGCTRLDLAYSTIAGTVAAPDPSQRSLAFTNTELSLRRIAIVTADDGGFEVKLEPGTWVVQIDSPGGGVVGCRPSTIVVEAGIDQSLELICP